MLCRSSLVGMLIILVAAVGAQGQSVSTECASFGMGCFWCAEAIFSRLRGVEKVEVGFAGGAKANPSYREVCSGDTGHAEVVRVTYDPAVIPYQKLLEVYFAMHDPTTVDQQGVDVGSQYRSVIFTYTSAQEAMAQNIILKLDEEHVWSDPIVTQVLPMPEFYPAEAYHRDYYKAHPHEGYCRMVIAPKVAKLREVFSELLKR